MVCEAGTISAADLSRLKENVEAVNAWTEGGPTATATMASGLMVPSPLKVITDARLFKAPTAFSAAVTYTDATQPVTESGIVYAPLPDSLPIGPAAFNVSEWYVLQSVTSQEVAVQEITTHDMASDADYTLTGAQSVNAIVRILDSGVLLTTGRNIVVPDPAREWTFDNATLQSLTVKTLAGAGVQIPPGSTLQVYSDGTDVLPVEGHYDAGGAGSVASTVQIKLNEGPSVFDKMTPDQIENVRSGALTLDVSAAVQTALTEATGRVRAPAGSYLMGSKFSYPATKGVSLIGEGETRTSASNYPTQLVFTHTDGPCIKLVEDGQSLQNMAVKTSGARNAAALDLINFGVLLERPDTGTLSLGGCSLRNVEIEEQPSHGFATSGDIFMPIIDGLAVRECKGHAIILSDGRLTGRTNTARPGGGIFNHLRTFKNGGHDFVMDDLDTGGAFRMIINDADFASRDAWLVDIDPLIKIANSTCIFHGENIVLTDVAFNGRLNGTPTYSAFQFSGRVHRYNSCRYVGVVGIADGVLGTVASTTTDDIIFDGVFPTNDSTASPAISITGAVGTVGVLSQLDAGSGILAITNWFPAAYVKGFVMKSAGFELGNRTVTAAVLQLNGGSATALQVTRDSAECGQSIIRTGTGATSFKQSCIGGTFNQQTLDDADHVFGRNGIEGMRLKSNTMNIAVMPTSAAGLSAGDLWNNSGAVTIV